MLQTTISMATMPWLAFQISTNLLIHGGCKVWNIFCNFMKNCTNFKKFPHPTPERYDLVPTKISSGCIFRQKKNCWSLNKVDNNGPHMNIIQQSPPTLNPVCFGKMRLVTNKNSNLLKIKRWKVLSNKGNKGTDR